MKNILLIYLLLQSLVAFSQRGFKADLGLNPIENNRGLNVIEHDSRFYFFSRFFDIQTNAWNTALAIFDYNGLYIKHKLLRDDTIGSIGLNNYIVEEEGKISIHGSRQGETRIITYDFDRDSLFVSGRINWARTLTGNWALLTTDSNELYGCGGRVYFGEPERIFEYRVVKIEDADTLYYINPDTTKFLLPLNARINQDGNLVVLGSNSIGNGYMHLDSTFVTIFDPDLNVIHNTLYSDLQAPVSLHKGMYIDSRNEIVCTHDRRYLIDTTLIGVGPNDDLISPGVSKFDETGKHLWTVEFGNNINNTANRGLWESIIESQEKDGYVIVGAESYLSETKDTLYSDAAIAKISLDGDSIWMHRYSYEREGTVATDIFHDVYPTSDGGYVAVGGSNGSDMGPNPFLYSIIMKLDSEGRLDTTSSTIVTVDKEAAINVYPNPTVGPVYIQQEGNLSYNIQLIDPSGKVLKEFQLRSHDHTVVLDEAHFSQPGVFYLRVRNENGGVVMRKFVVAK